MNRKNPAPLLPNRTCTCVCVSTLALHPGRDFCTEETEYDFLDEIQQRRLSFTARPSPYGPRIQMLIAYVTYLLTVSACISIHPGKQSLRINMPGLSSAERDEGRYTRGVSCTGLLCRAMLPPSRQSGTPWLHRAEVKYIYK